THYTQSSSNRSKFATRNRGKSIVNYPPPTYDSEPKQVDDDEASSKEKEIDKLMTLILMYFKKIYTPTKNNLRTSSKTKNMKVDNTSRSDRRTRYDRQTGQYGNQRAVNVVEARENLGTQYPEQSESVNNGCVMDKDGINTSPDSSNMCSEEGEADQDDDLANERTLWNIPISPEMKNVIEHKISPIVDDLATEMSCDYLEALKKCERLGNEFSKRNKNVKNKSFNELEKKFVELEKHFISLELALQHKNEHFQNARPCKYQDALEFLEFFEINELKAQLQDKNIAIRELKQLIAKMKGKFVDTKFVPSVTRQANDFKFQKPSVLVKPTPFSDSLEKKDFSKLRSVTITNVKHALTKPVTPQTLPKNANQMSALKLWSALEDHSQYHSLTAGLWCQSSNVIDDDAITMLETMRDGENLDKMKEKVETIHVNFDELPLVASDHASSDPAPKCQTTALELVLNSSVVSTTDASDKLQQPNTTLSTSITVAADTTQLDI
nr:hypothetical protein [Tanacetum cinerariifolium]